MTSNLLHTSHYHRDAFSSLGIGVDNLSMPQAVTRIFELIERYKTDPKARLVATLNVDFMVNALGYLFRNPSHPELLEILRSADLVTADGFPVVLLSRLMGTPLKERVTGSDLVPAIARRAASEGRSIYLLGGHDGSAKAAAQELQRANPGLRIAGAMSPVVHVTGSGACAYETDDAEVVSEINASGADILLIGLGNPKQEQWFHRNRHHLKVAVSIGVGGTFEFISGRVRRAPPVMQAMNLEWLFRITQDPARLWKRYCRGFFKIGLLTMPLLRTRLLELILARFAERRTELKWGLLWGSRQDIIQAVALPRYVTREQLQQLVADLGRAVSQQRLAIIDCSQVRHIELAGYQAFFQLGSLLRAGTVNGLLIGLRDSVRRNLEAGRIMDRCQHYTVAFEDLQLPTDVAGDSLRCHSYVLDDTSLVYLSGRIDGTGLTQLGLEICIADMARHRRCVIDLRYADMVESTAVAQFHRLVQARLPTDHKVMFAGVGRQTRTMFELGGNALPVISDGQLAEYIFSHRKGVK